MKLADGFITHPEFDNKLKRATKRFQKKYTMEVKHSDNGKTGLFFIEVDGKKEAEMTYKYSGNKQITIEHTTVDDALKGQGIGRKLFNATVDYLRKNNLKAIPECPYVKSVFDKNSEEFADVRA